MSHDADGGYYYEVQGLNSAGVVIAASAPLRVDVKAKPELEPPEWQGGKPTLMASADGSIVIKWKQVEGATQYGIYLSASNGEKGREFKSQQNSYVLRDLMPGKYELKLRSHGQTSKPGPFGKSRTVDRKSTRLNSSHTDISRMPSSA